MLQSCALHLGITFALEGYDRVGIFFGDLADGFLWNAKGNWHFKRRKVVEAGEEEVRRGEGVGDWIEKLIEIGEGEVEILVYLLVYFHR